MMLRTIVLRILEIANLRNNTVECNSANFLLKECDLECLGWTISLQDVQRKCLARIVVSYSKLIYLNEEMN